MTILAFYSVETDDFGFERHTFDDMLDEEAFEMLYKARIEDAENWNNRIHFYDVESFDGENANGFFDQYGIFDSTQMQEDFNDEELDNGYWMKILHIPSDDVNMIIKKYWDE